MKISQKLILIILLLCSLIYGSYLFKRKIGNHHAGDYITAITHPQRFADTMPLSSTREEQNLKAQNLQPISTIITVDTTQTKGAVNNHVFGNNIIAYDPTTYENWAKEYYGYSDYGAGMWDPKQKVSIKEVVKLAKDIGISVMRFPGGCGTHHYDWQKAIGKEREHFLFGIDEFLKVASEINAEPVITLSYFTEDDNYNADLVEYLNAPNDGANPNGGKDWACEREKNGHAQPYGVRYFEVGNEVEHGNHRDIKKVLPEDYARQYLKYYDAIKIVDPNAQVGVVLSGADWNQRVMEIVKDKVDFGIIHTYPTPTWEEKIATIPAKDIYKFSLAQPMIQDEHFYRKALALLRKKAGRDIPLAITEYNGGFVQEKPVPYRHALGTALLNAELLRIFMKPENNILMANYWNFNNSYTGMIANGFNGDYRMLNNPYYKRPNYYVFEMYAKHFGCELIGADIQGDGSVAGFFENFHNMEIKSADKAIISEVPLPKRWQIKKVNGVITDENGDIFSIVFGEHEQWNYYHTKKTIDIQPMTYYRLSGYIKTENLIDDIGVSLEMQDARGWNATHSAAMTEKVKGTTDWQYVETLYQTLPDARAVKIIVRRNGAEGPCRGKAFFKDVKLEKLMPDKIPYLSINASKNSSGDRIYLMVINKNMDTPITATIDLKNFTPMVKGNAWVLNGPSVDATNEQKHDNVRIIQHEFEIKGNPFEFTFEPHSLTAIEIERSRK